MRIRAFGTSSIAILANLCGIRMRFNKPPLRDTDEAIESDQARTPRGVSPFILWLVRMTEWVTCIKAPFRDIAQRFRAGDLSHLHIVEASDLESPHVSGWESKRPDGFIGAVWNWLQLRNQTVRQLTQPGGGSEFRDDLFKLSHSGGGTGGPLLVTDLERCQALEATSGGNLHPRSECFITLQDTDVIDEQTIRLEQNSAATVIELGALVEGGWHFPLVSLNGWGEPYRYTIPTGLTFLHNPGDRGFSRETWWQSAAYALYLIGENEFTSPAFHRDADDRKSAPALNTPRCSTLGASSIRTLRFEKEWYLQLRLCLDTIHQVQQVKEDSFQRAKAELNHRQLREDGRLPGLAVRCREAAFENGDPVYGRIRSKPPRALRVRTRLQSTTAYYNRIRREIEPLRRRLLQSLETLLPQVEADAREIVNSLAASRSLGEVQAILRNIPEVLEESGQRLSDTIQKTHLNAESAHRQSQNILAEARRYHSLPLSQRLRRFRHHQARPLAFQRSSQQRLLREQDEIVFSNAALLQDKVRSVFDPYLQLANHWSDRLTEARNELDHALSNLLSGLEHGTPGCFVETPAGFEETFRRLPNLDRIRQALSNRLSVWIRSSFNELSRPPSSEEIQRFLLNEAKNLLPTIEGSVEETLRQQPDPESSIRKAIQSAAPLLSVDVTQTVIDELFLVALVGGETSVLAGMIRKEAVRLGLPAPKFVDWPYREEIAFLRSWFNIPLRAVRPIQRAEQALAAAALEDQVRSFKIPIQWLLPRITVEPKPEEIQRRVLMAAISDQLHQENGHWVLTPQGGTSSTLTDLSPESVIPILGSYTCAIKIVTWFICQTLKNGFTWAYTRLESISNWPTLKDGDWSDALCEFAVILAFLARKHHEKIGGTNHVKKADQQNQRPVV